RGAALFSSPVYSAFLLFERNQRRGELEELVVAQICNGLDLQSVQQLFVVSLGEAGERRRGRGEDLREGLVLVLLVEHLVEHNVDGHTKLLRTNLHVRCDDSAQNRVRGPELEQKSATGAPLFPGGSPGIRLRRSRTDGNRLVILGAEPT